MTTETIESSDHVRGAKCFLCGKKITRGCVETVNVDTGEVIKQCHYDCDEV